MRTVLYRANLCRAFERQDTTYIGTHNSVEAARGCAALFLWSFAYPEPYLSQSESFWVARVYNSSVRDYVRNSCTGTPAFWGHWEKFLALAVALPW